ncbi:MAG: pectin acetylesterase-family hydrolase [Chloroflexota bacterium]
MRNFRLIALLFLLMSMGSAAKAQDAAQWMTITPGGVDEVCARGTPYSFFVRQGDPNKLLIFFQGGGGCWNDDTCAPNTGLFDEVVEGNEAGVFTQGIFDATNAENPLAGYSIVFVSYCTGDYHLGTQAVEYASGTIQHRGAVDAAAALNWTFANYPRPQEVVVAGCSAGAIGSIYHTPTIARRYRSARLTQFGDAGVGVINPGWGGFDVWGMRNRRAAPDQVVTALYNSAARSYPRAHFAQYTTYNDSVQTGYYVLTGAVNAWPLEMESRISGLQRNANFDAYVAPGSEHCIASSNRFYTEAVEGVRFRDWFAALVAGTPIDSVHCSAC